MERADLDDKDRKIISIFERDPEISQAEIAQQVGLSQPTVGARLQKLKQTGAIASSVGMDLKKIGYEVGSGFMVGSPGQTSEQLAEDMLFLHELQPQMVGIGPFIPHHDTPFASEQSGAAELTLFMLAMIRLMLPAVLLPATTALGTVDPEGREKGILAGANVVMLNLSPLEVKDKYLLYDNKICTGDEAAECRNCLEGRISSIGYRIVVDRGDSKQPKAEVKEDN
jgi:biotin synthase